MSYEVVLETRSNAEEILSQMNEFINMYGVATVADLRDLAGFSYKYTDQKYGWIDIHNAEIKQVKNKYSLVLPKPIPIQ